MPIFHYFPFFPLFLAQSVLYFLLFHLSVCELFCLFLCSFSVRWHTHVDFQLFSQKSSGIPETEIDKYVCVEIYIIMQILKCRRIWIILFLYTDFTFAARETGQQWPIQPGSDFCSTDAARPSPRLWPYVCGSGGTVCVAQCTHCCASRLDGVSVTRYPTMQFVTDVDACKQHWKDR